MPGLNLPRLLARERNRKPVTFNQLCAIARAELERELGIDDGEWKARVKDRLVALEFQYPDGDMFERALSAVGRQLAKQRTRPVEPSAPAEPEAPGNDPAAFFDGPEEYRAYILSAHWQEVREGALTRFGHRCALCNGSRELNVHHRTYERLGYEQPGDVVVLCRFCHAWYHMGKSVLKSMPRPAIDPPDLNGAFRRGYADGFRDGLHEVAKR